MTAGPVNCAAAKAGIVGVIQTLAKEWGRLNTTVNCVAFALVKTRLTVSVVGESTARIEGHDVEVGMNLDLLATMERTFPRTAPVRRKMRQAPYTCLRFPRRLHQRTDIAVLRGTHWNMSPPTASCRRLEIVRDAPCRQVEQRDDSATSDFRIVAAARIRRGPSRALPALQPLELSAVDQRDYGIQLAVWMPVILPAQDALALLVPDRSGILAVHVDGRDTEVKSFRLRLENPT